MAQVNMEEAYNNYIQILNTGCDEEIEKAKYRLLWESSNLLEVVINYVALNQYGLEYDFGKDIIPKGTKLYRIRDYNTDTDFSNPNQWTPPHHISHRTERTAMDKKHYI